MRDAAIDAPLIVICAVQMQQWDTLTHNMPLKKEP